MEVRITALEKQVEMLLSLVKHTMSHTKSLPVAPIPGYTLIQPMYWEPNLGTLVWVKLPPIDPPQCEDESNVNFEIREEDYLNLLHVECGMNPWGMLPDDIELYPTIKTNIQA